MISGYDIQVPSPQRVFSPAGPVLALHCDTSSAAITTLRQALCERLEHPGFHPPLLLVPPTQTSAQYFAARIARLPEKTAVILATSGSSSGEGKLVGLTASQLLSSALATLLVLADYPHSASRSELPKLANLSAARKELPAAARAAWISGLPTHHIAGLQVITRAILADTPIITPAPAASFAPENLAAAARQVPGGLRCYTSLVPTQIHRLVQAEHERACETISRVVDVVIVGGAALPAALSRAAASRGLQLVRSYGMSETAGGCVYDGRALPGVRVRLQREAIALSGPMVTDGYLHEAEPRFARGGDLNEIITNDRGEIAADGTLQVLGRLDDTIITGGENVAPAAVEAALVAAGMFGVIVPVADAQWGQLVTFVTAEDHTLTQVRAALGTKPAPWRPRALVHLDALPEGGPGKIDRRTAAIKAAALLQAGDGERYERKAH